MKLMIFLAALACLAVSAQSFAGESDAEFYADTGIHRRMTDEEMAAWQRDIRNAGRPHRETAQEAEFYRQTGIPRHYNIVVAPSTGGMGVKGNTEFRLRVIPHKWDGKGEMPSTAGIGYRGNSNYQFRLERRRADDPEAGFQVHRMSYESEGKNPSAELIPAEAAPATEAVESAI